MRTELTKWVFFFFALVLFSCKENIPEENARATSIEGTSSGSPFFTLTQEQIDIASLEFDVPKPTKITSSIECTGRVDVPPENLASVYAPVDCYIRSARFLPGDYIKKGETMAVVSHPEIIRIQREFLETKSKLTFLENDVSRKAKLLSAQSVSEKEFDMVQSEYLSTLAHYRGLNAELDWIGIHTEQIEKEHAIQSEINILAPIKGYITESNVNLGKYVPKDEKLFEISNNDHVHLEMNVFAKHISSLKKGQAFKAKMPGSTASYTGELFLIGKKIDPGKGTVIIHGHFSKEPVRLIPGTFMQVIVFTEEETVNAVPEEAIIQNGDQSFVFIKSGDRFKRVAVTTGKKSEGNMEISGVKLQNGETIVVKGAYYLTGLLEEE